MILLNMCEYIYIYIYIYIIGFITLDVPVMEMSTRGTHIPFSGKGGRCVILTTLPTSCTDCLEIWEPHPLGNLRVCPGL
jgi:hypothetical protein